MLPMFPHISGALRLDLNGSVHSKYFGEPNTPYHFLHISNAPNAPNVPLHLAVRYGESVRSWGLPK